MAGVPLEEAKKSAAYIVSKMRDIDRLAIVTYDHNARVILPSQRVLNKAAINEVIFSITGGGSTDLHQGWLAGAEEVARNKSSNSLNRVLAFRWKCEFGRDLCRSNKLTVRATC